MKKIVVAFFLLISYVSPSQEVKWSREFELNKIYDPSLSKTPGYDMIGYSDDHITIYTDSKPWDGFQYTRKNADVYIQIFSRDDLGLKEDILIDTKEELRDGENYIGINFFNNTAYMTVGTFDEEDKNIVNIYLRPFDIIESFVEDKIELGSVKRVMRSSYVENLPTGYLRTSSEDYNLKAYYTRQHLMEKKMFDPDQTGVLNEFRIYNNEKDEWEKITYKTDDLKHFRVHDFCIGNDGSFCVLAFPYLNSQGGWFSKNEELKGYLIYRIKGQDVKHQKFTYDKTTSKIMSLIPTNDGQFIFFGHVYSNDYVEFVYTHSFTQVLNADGLSDPTLIEYEDDFKIEFWNEKDKQKVIKKDKYPPGYTGIGYPDIHYSEDGFKYVVFRVDHTETLEDSDYHAERLPFVREHLVMIKLDNAGKVEWKKNIYMRRATSSYSANDGDASRYFNSYIINNKIYIMFNENVKGENGEDVKTRMIAVDEQGNISEEFSQLFKANDLIIRPEFCVELDDNVLMMYASNSKDQRIGTLDLNQ